MAHLPPSLPHFRLFSFFTFTLPPSSITLLHCTRIRYALSIQDSGKCRGCIEYCLTVFCFLYQRRYPETPTSSPHMAGANYNENVTRCSNPGSMVGPRRAMPPASNCNTQHQYYKQDINIQDGPTLKSPRGITLESIFSDFNPI